MTEIGPSAEDSQETAQPVALPGGLGAESPVRSKSRRGAVPRSAGVELRLVAEPEQLAALACAPPILVHARNKGTVRLIKATYYDTPSGTLHRAGATFQVRQTRKGFVQVLSGLPGNGGEPLPRREWETMVATEAPDLQSLAPLASVGLNVALTDGPLQPVFTTELRRHVRTLEMPGGTVEVAIDRGKLVAGTKAVPISEIRLELKRGNPQALYDLALALSDVGQVRPATRTSIERGYGLAFDAPPAARKPAPPLSGADLTVDDAFAAILRACHSDILANQAAAEDGRDPEGVHQLRVALRRLRCALGLLKQLAPSAALDGLRTDAKWLGSSVGEARNWDVFLTATLPQVARECDQLTGFEPVRDAAEQHRAAAYAGVRAALAERRCGRFELTLGAWIEQRGWRSDLSEDDLATLASPAVSFATRALARQHGKVRKRGRGFKQLSMAARHELRLAVKKLRYAADFFLPLLGSQTASKRYGRRLSRLQERLGRYNDAATTRDLLERLQADELPAAGREAIGAIVGWQASGLARTEPTLRSAWRDFRRAAPPWDADGSS